MRPTHGHRARRSTSATRPPSCPDDGDFAEFAAEVAPLVDCDAEAAIPEPLRDYELPEPPADLAVRPYRHVAVVEATEPLPAPAPQTAPPDGWWPHSVHDIVEAWALDEIAEWLQRCTTWHRRGGLAHDCNARSSTGSASGCYRWV